MLNKTQNTKLDLTKGVKLFLLLLLLLLLLTPAVVFAAFCVVPSLAVFVWGLCFYVLHLFPVLLCCRFWCS